MSQRQYFCLEQPSVFLPRIYPSPRISTIHHCAKLVTFLKLRFLPLFLLLSLQALTKTIHPLSFQRSSSQIQGQKKPRCWPTFLWSPSSLTQLEASAICYELLMGASQSTHQFFFVFPKNEFFWGCSWVGRITEYGKVACWSGCLHRWISTSSFISVTENEIYHFFITNPVNYYTTQYFSGVSGLGNPLTMNFPFWWQLFPRLPLNFCHHEECKESVKNELSKQHWDLHIYCFLPTLILFQFARMFFFPSIIPHLSLDSHIIIFTLALVR